MEFDDSLSTSMGDFGEQAQDLEIPESLPMMAVRDVVVFNYMIIPLFVGRPGSIEAVNEALNNNKLLMLVTQKDPTKDDPEEKDLYEVGMVSMIMRTLKLPDGRLKVLVQALSKAKIRSYLQKKPFYRVEIDLIEEPETPEITVETEALMRTVREQTEKIMSLRGISLLGPDDDHQQHRGTGTPGRSGWLQSALEDIGIPEDSGDHRSR